VYLLHKIEFPSVFDVGDGTFTAKASECLLREANYFPDLLEAIGRSKHACEAIARKSYVHANGFMKLVLFDDPSMPFSVRLHVWTRIPRWEGTIHNHRWDFASLVLTGTIEFRNFVRSAEGQPYAAFSYAGSKAGRDALLPKGALRLSELPITRVQAGSIHSCDTEVFHQARACGSETTRTLLLQGRPKLNAATVAKVRAGGVGTMNRSTPIDHMQVSKCLLEASEGSRESGRSPNNHADELRDMRSTLRLGD